MKISSTRLTPVLRNSLLAGRIRLTALVVLVAPWVAFSQGTGSWHASGSQILDSKNVAVRITGVNWYGFETKDGVVHGLYAQDYHTILNTIQAEGFNTVRLPFSNQMVETPAVPTSISYSGAGGAINTDLKGLNSLQILDKVMAASGKLGLRVILDNHRSEAGNSNEANGLWYTSAYPESKWIADWTALASRYASYQDGEGNPTLIGVDLRNEPHLIGTNGFSGSCWTGDTMTNGCPTSNTAQNWPAAAGHAANAVLKVNPGLLIFVEGTDCYSGDCGWQGANLEGAGKYPVQASNAHQIVYSVHDYGPDLYQQAWFNGSTTEASLSATWNKFWGYLSAANTAPVWVGELGTTNDSASVESNTAGSQGQWFQSLISYLGNHPSIQWTYWALNGEDEFGLLDQNYDPTPVSSLKEQMLHSIQFPLAGEPAVKPCAAAPAAPGGVTATAGSSSAISVSWGTATPPASCLVSYNLYRGTSATFTPSSASLIASEMPATSFANSGLAASTKYFYIVEAVDEFGSSKASAVANATTAAAAKAPAASCHVAYSVANDWGTGFQVAITIGNTGTSNIASWKLGWTFPQKQVISSAWNATETQSGEAVTMTSMSYNGTIAPGGSVTGIGFVGSYTGTNKAPAQFTLNGVVCQ